jgi:hypothetical protein
MILSMGPGEPSYVPDGVISHPQDSADIIASAFLQCYGRDPLQWEIMCFFSIHQDEWATLGHLADELPCAASALMTSLAELAETKLLEERVLVCGPIYRLTSVPELRRLAVRLGWAWRAAGIGNGLITS